MKQKQKQKAAAEHEQPKQQQTEQRERDRGTEGDREKQRERKCSPLRQAASRRNPPTLEQKINEHAHAQRNADADNWAVRREQAGGSVGAAFKGVSVVWEIAQQRVAIQVQVSRDRRAQRKSVYVCDLLMPASFLNPACLKRTHCRE